jgi:hypothetical protein
MEKTGIYSKTPKGLQEIGDRALKLPPKLRQLLILVDGESDVATLVERFEAVGNVAGHLSALEQLGLIQANAGTSTPTSPAAVGTVDSDIDEIRRDISHLLLDSLGPNAEMLALKVEESRSREELVRHCEACRAVVQDMLGKARGDAFWAKARGILG